MFAVIYIHNFSLQSVLRHVPDLIPKPVVLTDPTLTKPCITQLTLAARASGICEGMTPSQAIARCGNLAVKTRSLPQEQAAMEVLMQTAYAFSPNIEATAPGICTLELKGLPVQTTETSAKQWATEILRVLKQFHLNGQLGFAETPALALLAAHAAKPVLVAARRGGDTAPYHRCQGRARQAGPAWAPHRAAQDDNIRMHAETETSDFISALPIEALDLPFQSLQILKHWGIKTAGAFLALGKDKLAERLGPAIVEVFARLSTHSVRPLKIASPPETFAEEIEFENEIETLEPLLFILRRFVEQLSRRIELLYLVVAELHLKLGLTSGATYERAFTIPSPTGNAETLFRVLHTHLETLRTEAPIATLRLIAKPGRSESHQFGLFETTLRNPNQFAETLARLTALCGPDRVGTPAIEATYRPDTFKMRPPDFAEQGCNQKSNRLKNRRDAKSAEIGHRFSSLRFFAPLRLEKCFQKKKEATKSGRCIRNINSTFPLGLSLRRFRPPLPARIEIREQRPVLIRSPVFDGAIAEVRGPFFSSGNWWENNRWWREEWDIQTSDGNLYRIFRPSKKTNDQDSSLQSGIGLPHSKTLREIEDPQNLRQVLECGSPMPLSSETHECTQSFELFTADSEKLSLTPRFSGVHKRLEAGINCFNSFSVDSSPLSQPGPAPLPFFLEGIYD